MRLGYRPGEWEHLQPIELYAYEDAQAWRRSRDLEALAMAAVVIANRIPFNKKGVKPRDLLNAMPGYEPDR